MVNQSFDEIKQSLSNYINANKDKLKKCLDGYQILPELPGTEFKTKIYHNNPIPLLT